MIEFVQPLVMVQDSCNSIIYGVTWGDGYVQTLKGWLVMDLTVYYENRE